MDFMPRVCWRAITFSSNSEASTKPPEKPKLSISTVVVSVTPHPWSAKSPQCHHHHHHSDCHLGGKLNSLRAASASSSSLSTVTTREGHLEPPDSIARIRPRCGLEHPPQQSQESQADQGTKHNHDRLGNSFVLGALDTHLCHPRNGVAIHTQGAQGALTVPPVQWKSCKHSKNSMGPVAVETFDARQ